MSEIYQKICELDVEPDNIFSTGNSVSIQKVSILEGTYTGDLNRNNIPLGYIAVELRKMGYNTTFHNQKGKYIRIISETGLENKIIKKTSSKLPVHQINIYDSGHIRVNSPGNVDLVENETGKFIQIVLDLIKDENYDDEEIIAENIKIILGATKRSKEILDDFAVF